MEPGLLLLDTNVLLGLTDLNLKGRRNTSVALRRFVAAGFVPRALAAQFREMYVILTRLGENGYQVDPKRAAQAVRDVKALVPLLIEPVDAMARWTEFIVEREVVGVRAHDLWIAATAQVLGASLLTDDVALRNAAGVPTFGTVP